MTAHDHSGSDERAPQSGSFLTSRAGLVLIGFLIIAGALMFTEHRAHVLGVLIWLPLLACPLMHFFMHGGHGHGNQGHGSHRPGGQQSQERRAP